MMAITPPSPSSLPPRRRWLRLSLRALMILIVAVAIPVGWVAHTIRTQREAIAAVRAAGGKITFDYQEEVVGKTARGGLIKRREPAAPAWLRRWVGDELFQSVYSVTFPKRVAPADLAALARFDRLEIFVLADSTGVGDGLRFLAGRRHLRMVRLTGPGVTDAGLAVIARLPSIQMLTLNGSEATDAGFAQLKALGNVTSLDLIQCPNLTDAGAAAAVAGMPKLSDLSIFGLPTWTATLQAVARDHPALVDLFFTGKGLTDDALGPIAEMTQLKRLRLITVSITDAGLAHLPSLKHLDNLTLSRCPITDAGLQPLGDLPALDRLSLNGVPITDAGLVHLIRSPVRKLDLVATQVTDAGMPTLGRMANLVQLTIRKTPGLTDAGLVPLRHLTRLRQLDLAETRVTPAGTGALQAALPTLTSVITRPRRPPAPAPKPAK